MAKGELVRTLFATTALCTLATPAAAQLAAPAPVRQSIDANGVDLFLGTVNVTGPVLSIGQAGSQDLSYYQVNTGSGWTDNIIASINIAGSMFTISLGGKSDSFTDNGDGTYTSTQANGATLVKTGSLPNIAVYHYTTADGTQVNFIYSMRSPAPYFANGGRVTSIINPSGDVITFSYDTPVTYCAQAGTPSGCAQTGTAYRILKVHNSYGYQLSYTYQQQDFPDPNSTNIQPWATPASATLINLAIASGASTPAETFSSTASGGTTYWHIKDAMNRETVYRMMGASAQQVAGITRPGNTGSSEDVTIAYASGKVSSVTRTVDATHALVTGYAWSDTGTIRTATVTDPLSHQTVYTFDDDPASVSYGRLKSVTDPLSHTTSLQYDSSGRVSRVTRPEGNYTSYVTDARGNVSEADVYDKLGANHLAYLANYPADCTNTFTCNEPAWTKDAKGNQTDYAYDPATGLAWYVTSPAPVLGGARPQTRYCYATFHAYFKDSSGTINPGEPVTRLTGTSAFQTGAAVTNTTVAPVCTGTGTADEVRGSIIYQSSTSGNNVLPLAVTASAGDGSVSARTTYGYDDVGNVVSVDGPLSGAADTTSYFFDGDREATGAIGPDPDNLGSLKRRAGRVTYDPYGRVTLIEAGAVSDATAAALAAMSAAQAAQVAYDGVDRPTAQTLLSGTTPYALTQYGYDHQRLDCTAVRMIPSATPPGSACTPASGGTAPDQISKTSYDAADRVTGVQSGYDPARPPPGTVVSYNPNGTVATLTDPDNNKTSYAYDGYDRLSQTFYPVPAKGAGASSASDYEKLAYDANGDVIERDLRGYAGDATQKILYGYDALGRVVSKDLPGSEPDVTYSYDNLGRLTGASQGSPNVLAFGYDALGRVLTQTGPKGTMTAAYDAAGRRTSLTWPDAAGDPGGAPFYVSYHYLTTGETTSIAERDAASGPGLLATFNYDDLGNRIKLTRGNGAITRYTPDPALPLSRLALQSETLGGTAWNATRTFGYNGAGQLSGVTGSNDLYAWGGHYNRSDAYATNGLNQLTAISGTSARTLAYDARGNTTGIGSSAYGYSSENLLTSGPGGLTLTYDALLRLQKTTNGTSATWLLYDGQERTAEYSGSGAVLRRYVYGPGQPAPAEAGEPLVWYEGADTSDRRWLHADERGSVTAVSDASGNALGVNTYDEYGVPASANLGKFGYTGQAWVPEIGMWYYKARMYAPGLGRFLQTDPIGYGDGPNLYGYVHGDPVNASDPTGLCADIIVCGNPGGIIDGGLDIANFLDPPLLASQIDNGANPPLTGDEDIIVTARSKPKGPIYTPGQHILLSQSVLCNDPYICSNMQPSLPSCNFVNNFCGSVPKTSPVIMRTKLRIKQPKDEFGTTLDGLGCITGAAAIETVATAALAGVSCGLFISDITESYQVKQ